MKKPDEQNNNSEEQAESPRSARKRKKGRRGHGEGSVFYNKSRTQWVVQITLEDGSQKQYYGSKTQEEAIARKNELLRELKQGVLATGPQQKLGAYLIQWLEDVHKESIRSTTFRRYHIAIEHHIIPTLGNIPLQKLTPQQVQAFYAKKAKEGMPPTTLKHMHSVLHVALKHAIRWGLISRNVCDLVSLPQTGPHEGQTLTLEQARVFLRTVKEHRLEALLVVALTTGMREGELLALKWQDIDLEQKKIQVRRTVVFLSGEGYKEHEPKTKKGQRGIIIPQVVVDALRTHKERQVEAKSKAGAHWKEIDLVFCNAYGYYRNANNLRSQFRKLLKKADLPEMRFHDLRHSAATILLGMGVHPKVVQELLGHSDIGVTMDVYSHVLPPIQKDAMDKWDADL